MNGKCELCGVQSPLTKHHLIPQTKCRNKYKTLKNDETNFLWICRQCHDHIHATYDNSTLRDSLHTKELLLNDENIRKFVEWRKKHPQFNGHAKDSKSKRN